MEQKQVVPFPLRMPSELRAAVEASAQRNGRSVNAEIVYHLERAMALDAAVTFAAEGRPIETATTTLQAGIEIARGLLETLEAGLQVTREKEEKSGKKRR